MAGGLTISTLNDSSGVLATQNGMSGIAKAWVNFNGAATPTINGSFNVSSVTRNGTGDHTINFTTAMPATTYAVTSALVNAISSTCCAGVVGSGSTPTLKTTSQVRVGTYIYQSAADTQAYFAVFA
jgi:hypothetical protein